MADGDFITSPLVERYLPVTKTVQVQAVENRVVQDETEKGFRSWVHFGARADKDLQAEFRDPKEN